MNSSNPKSSDKLIFLAVIACFFLSGFAALLYQAAWLKKLGILFGTSHIAVATVLAAYMGGLASGSAIASRWASRVSRPILTYGVLEAVIGVTAVLVPFGLGLAQYILISMFGNQIEPVSIGGSAQSLFYLVATFAVLFVPTAAMGATLPLLSRYAIFKDDQIGPRIGALYGVNTFGAVLGVLAAGFFLLPYFGLFGTLLIGAGINVAVFLIAVYLSRAANSNEIEHTHSDTMSVRGAFHWTMPVILISGSVSFTLEVLWTRLLSHVFGGTVYAFSIMLASFLTGIALGGALAGRISGSRERALLLFIVAQILIAAFSFLSYQFIDTWVPVFADLSTKSVYAFLVIFPSTLFIGATFPLAVRIACPAPAKSPAISGQIYAWNTIGAIIGAILTGFWILPALGFSATLKLAILVSLGLAAVSAFMHPKRNWIVAGAATSVLAITAVFAQPQRPDGLIQAYLKKDLDWGEERFYGVGQSATILMREAQGFINLSSNGLSEASIGRKGMPPFNLSQKWLSALPVLARPDAQSMLIVGYGGGVAVEGVPPSVEDVDVIELEPMVIEANKSVVSERGIDPLADPRVSLVINDARNAVLLTKKQYDIIISQPSHPWTGGASHLYTREFLGLAKSRLSEDGVFLQWINSQFVDEKLLRILMATLTEQFEHVELYQPERQVLLFLASDAPLEVWDGSRGAEQALEAHPRFYQRLGLRAPEDAIAMTLLDNAGVKLFSSGERANTDDLNRLAFFSRARADGLTAEDLADLFEDLDPLTNAQSPFHLRDAAYYDLPYIAEQLLQANFTKRAFLMARAASSADVQATIDALGYYHTDEDGRAEETFAKAIAINPANTNASFGLLRMYLGGFAERRLPEHIARLANEQSGLERLVLEGWVFGSSGAFDRLQALDADLARVSPTSLAYPIAVKLRVDWRIVYAQNSGDVSLAAEGLDILDDLLASHWNLDLYVLRAGAAYLAGDTDAFVESLATVARQVDARMTALARDGEKIPANEAQLLARRLTGMQSQLRSNMPADKRMRAEQVAKDIEEILIAMRS